MKKVILISLVILSAIVIQAQVKVSVLGDSYSTYQGWIPSGNEPWYGPGFGNDVNDVSQTWWHQLINDNGLILEINNSWSGATICNTGYNGEDYTPRSFLTRSDSLGEKPDLIFIFGGTNDSWAGAPLGDYNIPDMYTVRPATRTMLQNLKKNYPEALLVAIINTELSKDIEDILMESCEAENIAYVRLRNIDKQFGHPSVNGMKQIASQVWQSTAPLLFEHLKRKPGL